jgi:NAD(P)-dependent dehydrogenase (short-subunit alcohol dehydrogenase family)
LFEGKGAVVTGAGRGLGRAIAESLANQGAHVIAVARSSEEVDDLAQTIRLRGGATTAMVVDLNDLHHLDQVAEKFSEVHDIDILINNAGLVEPLGASATITAETVTSSLNVNLIAPMVLAFRLAPAMAEKGWGRIVNISSGVVARPGSMIGGNVYVTAKTGLEGHTLNLAAEYAGTGLTINAYRPGAVDTAMQKWIRTQAPERVGAALHDRFARSYAAALDEPSASVRRQRGVSVSGCAHDCWGVSWWSSVADPAR